MVNLEKHLRDGYVKEFIKFLKNRKIYDKYIQNYNNRNIYNVQEYINYAFFWANTPEGFNFWEDTHYEWNKYLTELKCDKKVKKLPTKIKKMGAEIESSPENINLLIGEINYLSRSIENDKIWELQLIPIDLKNFKEWWELYSTITKYCHDHVKGEYDVRAGSMHVHFSFTDLKIAVNKWDFNILLEINDLMKKSPEKEWRDAISYRSKIVSLPTLSKNNKHLWITYNSISETIEVRLNENPLPLWVYLVPILNEKFKGGSFKSYRNMFKKALAYWKEIMNKEDFQLFERVVSEYIKHFDPEKTIKKFGILQ